MCITFDKDVVKLGRSVPTQELNPDIYQLRYCVEFPAPTAVLCTAYPTYMMHEFSDAEIADLRRICEEEFGRTYSTAEARIMANNLLALYGCLRDISQRPDFRAVSEQAHQDQSGP